MGTVSAPHALTVRVGEVEDLVPGSRAVVRIHGIDLLVIRSRRGGIFVFVDRCPHGRSRLSDGTIRRRSLTCPSHGRRFRLADGRCVSGAAGGPLTRIPFALRDGVLYVELAD